MSNKETKSDRFRRLMQRRMERALEELRLVSQLSSPNYENTQHEAEEVVSALDSSLRHIAKSFSVPFTSQIGLSMGQAGTIDELDVIKAIELIKTGNLNEAVDQLQRAIRAQPR